MANQVKAPKVAVIDPASPEKAKLRVTAYARVSSDSADQLNSYLAQVDYYTRHIGENPDWELADIYADEKYAGRVLLQKTISVGGSKIKNDGFMDRYLHSDSHEAIISDEMFKAVQEERVSRKSQTEPESKSLTQAIFTIF